MKPGLSGSEKSNEVEGAVNSEETSTDDDDAMANGRDTTGEGSDGEQQKGSAVSLAKMDRVMFVQEIQQRLSRLSGLCAQMHPDWWNYEWCYDKKVTQFHINVDSVQAGNTIDIQLEDITSLGTFSESKITSFLDENNRPNLDPNAIEGLDFAEGR